MYEDIEEICSEYGIKNYTINPDGSVDTQGNVYLRKYKITKLPLEFGRVSGCFDCDYTGLTTLEGCPKEVGLSFYCSENHNLTSLEGLEDTIIRGDIVASGCGNLYSLDNFPINFKGEFYCRNTPIKPIYDRYIIGSYIKGTNQLAQAIQFFNQLQVVEEGSFGWEISYRRLLEYLKRYKEFGRPTKEEVQYLVGDNYIVR